MDMRESLVQLNDWISRAGQTVARTPISPLASDRAREQWLASAAELAPDWSIPENWRRASAEQQARLSGPSDVSALPGAVNSLLTEFTHRPSVGQAGEDAVLGIPRMAANVAMLPLGGGGAAIGLPGMLLGAGDAALASGAPALAEGAGMGEALLRAGIGGGTFAAMPAAANVGGNIAARVLARTPLVNSTLQELGTWGGKQAGMFAAGSAGGAAEQVAAGVPVGEALAATVSPEALAGQAIGQLAFLPMDAHEILHRAPGAMTMVDKYKLANAQEAQRKVDMMGGLTAQFRNFMDTQGVDISKPLKTEKAQALYAEGKMEFAETLPAEQREEFAGLTERLFGYQNKHFESTQEFAAAFSGLGKSNLRLRAQDAAKNSEAVKKTWSAFAEEYAKDPDSEKLTGMVKDIQATTDVERRKALRQLGVVGELDPVSPEFELLSRSGSIDFSGQDAANPQKVVEAVLSGQLEPSGTPAGRAYVEKAVLLREVLKPGGVRQMYKERLLTDLGQKQLTGTLVGEEVGKWETLSTREREAALLLADIYTQPTGIPGKRAVGPREVLGLGTQIAHLGQMVDTWVVNDKYESPLDTATKSTLAELNKDITSPADMGQRFATGNEYIDALNTHLKTRGLKALDEAFDIEAGNMPEMYVVKGGDIVRFTEPEVHAIYQDEIAKSVMDPVTEATSRVTERVKTRVIGAHLEAKRRLEGEVARRVKVMQDNVRQEAVKEDVMKDAAFTSKMVDLPEWVQDVIGTYYSKAAEVENTVIATRQGKREAKVTRLDAFRKEVGAALDSLTPEQKALLAEFPKARFPGVEYNEVKKRVEMKGKPGTDEGDEGEVDTKKRTGRAGYGDEPYGKEIEEGVPKDIEAAQRKDAERLAQLNRDLQPLKDALEKVAVKVQRVKRWASEETTKDDEGKDVVSKTMEEYEEPMGTNLWKVLRAEKGDFAPRRPEGTSESAERNAMEKAGGPEVVFGDKDRETTGVAEAVAAEDGEVVGYDPTVAATMPKLELSAEEASGLMDKKERGVYVSPTEENMLRAFMAKGELQAQRAKMVEGIRNQYFDIRGPMFDPLVRIEQMSPTELIATLQNGGLLESQKMSHMLRSVQNTGWWDGPQLDVSTKPVKGAIRPTEEQVYALKLARDTMIADVLAADLEDQRPIQHKSTPTERQKELVQKYWKQPTFKTAPGQSMSELRVRVLGYGAKELVGEGTRALFQTTLAGYNLKPGVDLTQVQTKLAEAMKTESAGKFNDESMKKELARVARSRGLSPQWFEDTYEVMKKVMVPFTEAQNTRMMGVKDEVAHFEAAFKNFRALGLYLPGDAIIGGVKVKNPIIALDFNRIMEEFGGGATGRFMLGTTAAHEVYHNWTDVVVKNPTGRPAHEQVQIKHYLQLITSLQKLDMVERVSLLREVVKTMVPNAEYVTKEGNISFKQQWQEFVIGAVRNPEELAAVFYSFAVHGALRSEMQEGNAVQRTRENLFWLPDELRDFTRGQFRNLADFSAVIQTGMEHPMWLSQNVKKFESATANEPQRVPRPVLEGEIGPVPTTPVDVNALVRNAQGSFGKTLGPEIHAKFQAEQRVKNKAMQRYYAEISKMDPRMVAADATLAQMDAFMSGPGAFEAAMEPGGLKTLQVSEDIFPQAELSALFDLNLERTVSKKLMADAAEMVSAAKEPGTTKAEKVGVLARNFTLFSQFLWNKSEATTESTRNRQVYKDAIYSMMYEQRHKMYNDYVLQGQLPTTLLNQTPAQLKMVVDFFNNDKTDPSKVRMCKAANDVIGRIQTAQGLEGQLNAPGVQRSISDAISKHALTPDEAATLKVSLPAFFEGTSRLMDRTKLGARHTQSAILAGTLMHMQPGQYTAKEATTLAGQLITYQADPMANLGLLQQVQQTTGAKGLRTDFLAVLVDLSKGAKELLDGYEKLQEVTDTQGNVVPGVKKLFASEQRYGRWMVSWMEPGAKVRSTFGFQDERSATQFLAEQVQAGKRSPKVHDKAVWSDDAQMANTLMDSVDGVRVLGEAFERQMGKLMLLSTPQNPQLGMEMVKTLREKFNPTVELAKRLMSAQTEKDLAKREFMPGREKIDYLDNYHFQREATLLSVVRKEAQNDVMLQALEMRQGGDAQAADMVLAQWKESVVPESSMVRNVRQFVAMKAMAMNVPSTMMELASPLQNGLWVLTREGGMKQAVKSSGEAMRNYLSYGDKATGAMKQTLSGYQTTMMSGSATQGGNTKLEVLVAMGALKRQRGFALTKEEAIAEQAQKLLPHMAQYTLAEDLEGDVGNVNISRARAGNLTSVDKVKLATEMGFNGVMNVMKYTMKMRQWVVKKTQDVGMLAALDMGYEKGLREDELMTYAAAMSPQLSFTGGKSIRPYALTQVTEKNQPMRNTVGMLWTLQTWQVGMTAQICRDWHSAIMGQKGMTMEQRGRAAQAAVGATAATITLAGAFGMPFAAAMLAAVQKATGVDVEAAAREMLFATGKAAGGLPGMSAIFKSDDESGHFLTDVAMNGLVNHVTGLDFASRAGVNSVWGMNPDTGFSFSNLLGPTAGTVGDAFAAVKQAMGGQVGKAALRVAPTALKPLVRTALSYHNYGDLRMTDANDQLIAKPEGMQKIAYGLFGMQPTQAGQVNRESRLIQRAEEFAQLTKRGEHTEFAKQLLRGDTQGVLQYAYEHQQESTFNPQSFISSVVDRALDMQSPKDALEQGSLATSRERAALGKTFSAPSRSALERLQGKEQMMAQLGYPFGAKPTGMKEWMKASVVDQLVQQRGVTRQEASRMVALQMGF